jgi:ABC-type transporter Mla maintaining outer membrane lipid asymmetry ATPase subunit MlaF
MAKAKIIFNDVTFRFENSPDPILDHINATAMEGETTYVFGNSGGGKSTFLKLAAGLLQPASGSVLCGDLDVGRASKPQLIAYHRKTAFIFQDSGLLNNMNVYDNLALPLRYDQDVEEKDVKLKVRSVLDEMGILKDEWHFPGEMSRSERKLANVGRAIIINPEILFYDEPLEGLDYIGEEKVKKIILRQKLEGRTILMVSQDLRFAMQVADRIIVLFDGAVVFEGPPAGLFKNEHFFIKQLLTKPQEDKRSCEDEN